MSDTRPTDTRDDEHSRVRLELPWLVNGTLPAERAAIVERHVAGCERCRAELELDGILVEHLRVSSVVEPAPQVPLAAVMARIDRHERRLAWWRHLRRGLSDTYASARRRPLVVAIGLQSLAIAALAVAFIGTHLMRQPAAEYRTLTLPDSSPAAASSAVRVIFDEDLTVSGIRALLDGVRGRIVAGPSPAGVFILEFDADSTASEGKSPVDAVGLAARLRATAGVRFAEPAP